MEYIQKLTPEELLNFAQLAKKYDASFFTPVFDRYNGVHTLRLFKTLEDKSKYEETADPYAIFRPSLFFFDMSEPLGPQIVNFLGSDLPKHSEIRSALMRFIGTAKDWAQKYHLLLRVLKRFSAPPARLPV
ncbi:MAG: hypothetical protein OSB62_08440 [Alphaproteobacteria bacterium]|nr:hypothetical protein [Alphaproteobacteria bacterium]